MKNEERLEEPLTKVRGWLKFIGIIAMIGGILQCLTIVGAIIGWVPIWLGSLLMGAAKDLELCENHEDSRYGYSGHQKIAKFFVIVGVLLIIYLVFTFFLFIVYGFLISTVIANAGQFNMHQ